VLAPQREAELVTQATEQVSAAADAKESTVRPNSIAVLPFANMSGDAANDYFSDGISEEILNVLAGVPELQVAARTSSFSFKGKAMEVPEIARSLKVRMILEGSVRQQGDTVRITAQLIDAESGFHRWSQTYDRKLQDIFAIQDEIAKAIGDELKVTVGGPAAGGNSTGTKSVEAYDLYLRGMAAWHRRLDKNLWEAIELFDQALALDPEFTQAYAGQALTYSVLPAYSERIAWDDALARANDLALRALALDPNLPEPLAALAATSSTNRHGATAIALLHRAISLRPSFATAHHWLGVALLNSGRIDEAVATLEHAAQLDPRSPAIADNLAFTLLAADRSGEARAVCEQALSYATDYPACLQYVATVDLMAGKLDAARPLLERMAAVLNPGASAQGQEITDALAGRSDRHALAQRMAALPFNSCLIDTSGNTLEDQIVAAVLMMLGEHELALDYMERNVDNLGSSMNWAVMLPSMDPIRCEPRFVAIIAKLRTTDPYLARACSGKQ
jgi:adenylate cyclase